MLSRQIASSGRQRGPSPKECQRACGAHLTVFMTSCQSVRGYTYDQTVALADARTPSPRKVRNPPPPKHTHTRAHLSVSMTSCESGVKGMEGGMRGRLPPSSSCSHFSRCSSSHSL